jgi:TPR repeat protein
MLACRNALILLTLCVFAHAANIKIKISHDADDEEMSFVISGISLTATGQALFNRVSRQESLPANSFDMHTQDGKKVDSTLTLLEQGITESNTLTLLPRPSEVPSESTDSSTTSTTSTTSTISAQSTKNPTSRKVPTLSAYKLQAETFVQTQHKGQLWHIVKKVSHNPTTTVQLQRRLVPSALVFEELYGHVLWSDVKIIPDMVLDAVEMGVPEIIRNMTQPTYQVLAGPVPIRRDLGIPCHSPFGYGVMSAISFWFRPWIENQQKNDEVMTSSSTTTSTTAPTHKSIFHTLPIKPGILSPVLLLRNRRLFVGHTAERRGNNVDLRGQLTDVVLREREWHHLSVLYDATSSTLQLYHNGVLAGIPMRVHDDTHQVPFQKVSQLQRKVVFGSGSILKGASGIVDNVLIHAGHAASQIAREHRDGYQYVENMVPMWLDAVAWPHNGDDDNNGGNAVSNGDSSTTAADVADNIDDIESSSEVSPTLFDLGMAMLSAPPLHNVATQYLVTSVPTSDVIDDSNNANVDHGNEDFRHNDWRVRTVARMKKNSQVKTQEKKDRQTFALMTDVEIVAHAFKRWIGNDKCIVLPTGWWTYELCPQSVASQKHSEPDASQQQILGSYDSSLTLSEREKQRQSKETTDLNPYGPGNRGVTEIYTDGAMCSLQTESSSTFPRKTTVNYICCPGLDPKKHPEPHFLKVAEKPTCHYTITVCILDLCGSGPSMSSDSTAAVAATARATAAASGESSPSSTNPNLEQNIALGAEGFSSSVWSQLYIAEMAVDGALDTMWKSHITSKDKTPWVAIHWQETCESGIEMLRVLWDLAPMAYSVSVGIRTDGTSKHEHSTDNIPNVRWSECLDIARQPTQDRNDLFLNGPCALDARQPVNWINVSISHPGSWTAPSLKEIQVTCRKARKDSVDKMLRNAGESSGGGSEEVASTSEGTTQQRVSEENEEQMYLEMAMSGLDELLIAMRGTETEMIGEGGEDGEKGEEGEEGDGEQISTTSIGYPRDHRGALSAFVLQVLVGSSSTHNGVAAATATTSYDTSESGAFLAVANHHYLGSPVDYVRRLLRLSNRTYATRMYSATEPSCSASAALYWHEARAAVGGDRETGLHPTPIQELKLSTADQEEIDRHRGDDGDEGTYQLSAADAGDVHAQKWIATRFYHGLNGFPQDLPRAAEYFAAAGDAGDAEARYNYGVMRLTGQDGQPADPMVAQEHFEAAAAQDFAPALNGLGIGHMGRGNGMPMGDGKRAHNFTAAAEFFRRAAKQNSADGHYNLGALYKDGQGVRRNIPAAMMHFVLAAMLGQHRAQWMLGDALHSSGSFLAKYLASYQYAQNKTVMETEDVSHWENEEGGYITVANASLAGIYVNISGAVVELPLQMSCDWAVEYLRPLAETRSAGEAFRHGVQAYLDGHDKDAERHFQASAWMGLSVGASNAAWMLRKDKRQPEETEALWPTTREEHSFSYSVVAAQRGDSVEHVAVANALSTDVQRALIIGAREGQIFAPLSQFAESHIEGEGEEGGGAVAMDYDAYFASVNEASYHDIDVRRLALAAWEGASVVGCPEASVEMGIKYIFGDSALSIAANETLAVEYLEGCRSVYGQSVTDTFSTDCFPAQILLWWLNCKNLITTIKEWYILF